MRIIRWTLWITFLVVIFGSGSLLVVSSIGLMEVPWLEAFLASHGEWGLVYALGGIVAFGLLVWGFITLTTKPRSETI